MSEHEHRLSELQLGESGQVVRVEGMEEQRRRLMDLGVIPGTIIAAEMASPMGDPTAYRIRGALIALRKDQAGLIVIEPEKLQEDNGGN